MMNNELDEVNVKKPMTAKDILAGTSEKTKEVKEVFQEKTKEIASKALEKVQQAEKLAKDDDYQTIADDNKSTVRNTGWISFAGPVLGSIGGPLAAIFTLGLDSQALATLQAVLIGSILGNLVGGWIGFANLKITVSNRTKMTYLYVKNQLGLLKQENDNLKKLEDKVKTLEKKLETQEEELMDYRIEKKAKELSKLENKE